MIAELGLAIIITLLDGQVFRCEQAVAEVGLVTCLNQCGQERCDRSLFCGSEILVPSSAIQQIELDR